MFKTKLNLIFQIRVKNIIERYKSLNEKVPKDLVPLLKPFREKVEIALKPGLTSITWVSTNIENCKIK